MYACEYGIAGPFNDIVHHPLDGFRHCSIGVPDSIPGWEKADLRIASFAVFLGALEINI